mgnify:CR=1 FL=1
MYYCRHRKCMKCFASIEEVVKHHKTKEDCGHVPNPAQVDAMKHARYVRDRTREISRLHEEQCEEEIKRYQYPWFLDDI